MRNLDAGQHKFQQNEPKQNFKDSYLATVLIMLLCVTLWGSAYVSYKTALLYFDPMFGSFARQLVALCIFLTIFGKMAISLVKKLTLSDWKKYSFVALCEPCLYFIFLSYGISLTTASQVGIIISCVPVVVAITAWVIVKERPSKYLGIGTAIVLIGIILINYYTVPSETAPNPLFGNILIIICCVCSAGYMVGLKKFNFPHPPTFSAIFMCAVGTLFFSFFLFSPTTTLPTEFPLIPTLCLIYTGTATNFGVYITFNYCIPRLPISQLTTFLYLIPVITMFLSWLLTGEQITFIEITSCTLILLGVSITQKR